MQARIVVATVMNIGHVGSHSGLFFELGESVISRRVGIAEPRLRSITDSHAAICVS